ATLNLMRVTGNATQIFDTAQVDVTGWDIFDASYAFEYTFFGTTWTPSSSSGDSARPCTLTTAAPPRYPDKVPNGAVLRLLTGPDTGAYASISGVDAVAPALRWNPWTLQWEGPKGLAIFQQETGSGSDPLLAKNTLDQQTTTYRIDTTSGN